MARWSVWSPISKPTRKEQPRIKKNRDNLQQLEDEVKRSPTNYQSAFNLASTYAAMQQPDLATAILDRMLADPNVQPGVLLPLAQAYASMTNWGRVESVLERLVKLLPNEAEPWYDLASIKAALNKAPDAIQALAGAGTERRPPRHELRCERPARRRAWQSPVRRAARAAGIPKTGRAQVVYSLESTVSKAQRESGPGSRDQRP